jgi:hypothetical protein
MGDDLIKLFVWNSRFLRDLRKSTVLVSNGYETVVLNGEYQSWHLHQRFEPTEISVRDVSWLDLVRMIVSHPLRVEITLI